MITIQREQYSVTVHLFIGTGHSPDKITFMSLTFTANHEASYLGLSSLFPFRSVSTSPFIIILRRSSFSFLQPQHRRSFILPSGFYLHITHTFISKPKPHVAVYVTLKNILVMFLTTFGRGRLATVAPRSIN
jgi:hypothetical protein